ncbi:glycosyltransferase [Claveliimonas bilis]|uniref:glycosyltransferase n=1 Tax=Claveliimonas bilis TaxID=3028070 RepID=UPI002931E54F|nr:glycosyltransferase [Claveliimonas bilis]BDZ79037.1 hypothetical protein Lac3_02460 [Claveliimonas bilis]
MSGRIGFVILHYNVISETMACVNSIIQNIDTDDYYIIIVDNKSPNHTGRKLLERYHEQERIKVILNSENLGFARGNNVGYRYAVEKLQCSFICILNNDTLLIQDDFFAVIKQEYEESAFGILGPKILLKDGQVNFLYYRFPDLQHFENELKCHKRDYWQMKWHLNYPIVACKLIKNRINKLLGRKKESEYRKYQLFTQLDIRREDVILHGCCIVFSPKYIEAYKEAFNPKTFLYKEEELLYLRCKKAELRIVYNPMLKIKHLEDMATNSQNRKRRDKIMVWLENQIRSLEVLIEELKGNE